MCRKVTFGFIYVQYCVENFISLVNVNLKKKRFKIDVCTVLFIYQVYFIFYYYIRVTYLFRSDLFCSVPVSGTFAQTKEFLHRAYFTDGPQLSSYDANGELILPADFLFQYLSYVLTLVYQSLFTCGSCAKETFLPLFGFFFIGTIAICVK